MSMTIKCKKCGYENQMGAIFCRGCGEKVDTSDLDPSQLEENKSKQKKSDSHFVRNLITAVIVLALAFVCFMMFSKNGLPKYEDPKSEYKESFEKLISYAERAERAKKNPGLRTLAANFEYTPEELTTIYNHEILDQSEADAKNNYVVKNVLFQSSGEELTVIIYSQFAGMDVVFTLTGVPQKLAENDAPVGFQLRTVKMGKFKLPFMKEATAKKFAPSFFDSPHLKKVFAGADEVEVRDGKLVFKFNGSAPSGK